MLFTQELGNIISPLTFALLDGTSGSDLTADMSEQMYDWIALTTDLWIQNKGIGGETIASVRQYYIDYFKEKSDEWALKDQETAEKK